MNVKGAAAPSVFVRALLYFGSVLQHTRTKQTPERIIEHILVLDSACFINEDVSQPNPHDDMLNEM